MLGYCCCASIGAGSLLVAYKWKIIFTGSHAQHFAPHAAASHESPNARERGHHENARGEHIAAVWTV